MRHLIIISTIIVFCLCGIIYARPDEKYPKVKNSQALIGGIGFSSTMKEIQNTFGKINKKEKSRDYDYCEGCEGVGLYFDRVYVYLVKNETIMIECTNEKYLTPAGIKISDSVNEIYEAYGLGDKVEDVNGVFIRYYIENTKYKFLVFNQKNDKTTHITLWTGIRYGNI